MSLMNRSRSTFEEMDGHVRHLIQVERTTRYEIGDALAHIRDDGGWKQGGFASFNAYLRSFGGRFQTLRAQIAFADSVPKEVALAFDPEWLGLALELLPPDGEGNLVVSMQVLRHHKLKVKRADRPVEIPLARATYDELQSACLHLHRRMSVSDDLVRQCEQAVKTVADEEFEFVPRRRKKQVGLGVFVPEHRVAEFLSWLAAAKRPKTSGASSGPRKAEPRRLPRRHG